MTKHATVVSPTLAQNPTKVSARDKVLRTAITLFNRDGIHETGVDRIIAEADVAKMTFYKHFPSKAALVDAYLDFKERARNENLLLHTVKKTTDPAKQILGIFDSLEDWFCDPEFKGCPFVRGLYEFNREKDAQAHARVASYFGGIGAFVEHRLKDVVKRDKVKICRDQILSLIVGSVIMALASGNPAIAQTNKKVVEDLLRKLSRRAS